MSFKEHHKIKTQFPFPLILAHIFGSKSSNTAWKKRGHESSTNWIFNQQQSM